MITMENRARHRVRAWMLGLAICGGVAMPPQAVAQPGHDLPVWALAGVNAAPAPEWLAVVRYGYVGGFESRLLLADLLFAPVDAWQLVVGYVHLDPANRDARATSVLRAGAIWRPLRGRVVVENRLLGERLANASRPTTGRVRDRVTVSFSLGGWTRLHPFASAEFFAVRSGLDAQRYQVGGSRTLGRITFDVYWTHQRPRLRTAFNTLGLTCYVKIGRAGA